MAAFHSYLSSAAGVNTSETMFRLSVTTVASYFHHRPFFFCTHVNIFRFKQQILSGWARSATGGVRGLRVHVCSAAATEEACMMQSE